LMRQKDNNNVGAREKKEGIMANNKLESPMLLFLFQESHVYWEKGGWQRSGDGDFPCPEARSKRDQFQLIHGRENK